MAKRQSLGAFIKSSGDYILAKSAQKGIQYLCPDCGKDVILCKGEIKVHHFRHYSDSINPCTYYEHPSESQIHKDAKLRLKYLIENSLLRSINRSCYSCNKKLVNKIKPYDENKQVFTEYTFKHNGTKCADLAYIDTTDEMRPTFFEIYNTHRTAEKDRVEPWFEIRASEIIDMTNTDCSELALRCIRDRQCKECKEKDNDKRIRLRDYYYQHTYNHTTKYVHFSTPFVGNYFDYSNNAKTILDAELIKYNTLIHHTDKDTYQYYTDVINKIPQYGSTMEFTSKCWNKEVVLNIEVIKQLIKKYKLPNPQTLFTNVLEKAKTIKCEKCNQDIYCTCGLTNDEAILLANLTCLICKGSRKRFGYPCYCTKKIAE